MFICFQLAFSKMNINTGDPLAELWGVAWEVGNNSISIKV